MNRAQALLNSIQELSEEKEVWDRKNPKKKHKRKTAKQKKRAKEWAKRNGKPYPSLVANLHGMKKSG